MDNFNNNEDEVMANENEIIKNQNAVADALTEIETIENLISAKKEEMQEYFSNDNNVDSDNDLNEDFLNLVENNEENVEFAQSEDKETTENDIECLETSFENKMSKFDEEIDIFDINDTQILETDLNINNSEEDDELKEYDDIDSIIASLNAEYDKEASGYVENSRQENSNELDSAKQNEETISDEREDDIEEIVKLLSAKFGNKKYENQFLKDDEEIEEKSLETNNEIIETEILLNEEPINDFQEVEEPTEDLEILENEDFIDNTTQENETIDAEGSFIYIDSVRYLIDNQIEQIKEFVSIDSEENNQEILQENGSIIENNQESLDNEISFNDLVGFELINDKEDINIKNEVFVENKDLENEINIEDVQESQSEEILENIISEDELGVVIDEIFGKKEEDLSETENLVDASEAKNEIIENGLFSEDNLSEDNLNNEENLENDINELLDSYKENEESVETKNQIVETNNSDENDSNEAQTITDEVNEKVDIENDISQDTKNETIENVTTKTDDINELLNEETAKDDVSEDDTLIYLIGGDLSFTYDTIKDKIIENSENVEDIQNNIVSEEDTLNFLTSESVTNFTTISLDGYELNNDIQKENNTVIISEEDTVNYLSSKISFEVINLSENTFNLPSSLSSETPSQEVKPEEKSENQEPEKPENQLIIDPTKAFIPAEEIYLKQSQTEKKTKKYFIGKNISYIMSIISLIALASYLIVISCKGDFTANYSEYIKNMVIIIVVFGIFVFMFKTLRDRFDDRNSKVFTMLQEFKEYKPVNNYLDGSMFDNRVKAVKDYLTFDLFVYILSLILVVIFAVPFITIADKNYSLLDCAVDCIKKFFVYEADLFKFLVNSSGEGIEPNISLVYSNGASKAISDSIKSIYSSARKFHFILCSIFSFVFVIFMAVVIVITIKNIIFQIIYLLDCKHKIKLQELDYKQYELRGRNAFVSRLINGIIFGIAFAIIMTLFVVMNVEEESNIIILLSLTVLLIIIVTLLILKKKLFKDRATLDSGLWFFPRYRQWIRYKYRKQILQDAKDTFARDYDEYIEEKQRIERERLESSKTYKIKTKAKKIFKIVVLSVTLVAVIYISFSFMDFLGMFHTGKYVREDDGTKCITLEKVGKVPSIDELMTMNMPSELKGEITYKIFNNEIVIYKNNEKALSATIKENVIYYNVDNIETEEEGDYITYIYKKEKLGGMQKFYNNIRVIFNPISKVYKFMSFS